MAATTCQQLIRRAFRICRVVRLTDEPTHQQADDAMAILNDMMHAMKVDNVQTDWVDVAIADDWPLQRETEEPVRYLLAARLASEYGVELPPEAATIASGALPKLQALFARRPRLEGNPAITRRTQRLSSFNINTRTFG